MKETQRRIQAYKAALPDLKERVLAAALLLVMSVAMLTSASFAWLTISRAPEVKGVNTTVAANGNLEIALASGDGTQAPAESQVGDSNLPIKERNLTWGNLVNLSDAAYGLENLTLRPARLNTSSLLTSPLYGAVYNKDGRIEKLTSNFGYAMWQPPQGTVSGYFSITDDYGVRAISSTKMENISEDETEYYNKVYDVAALNQDAVQAYYDLTGKKEYMESLSTLMGAYISAKLGSDPTCTQKDISNIYNLCLEFIEVYKLEAVAMAEMLNLYGYVTKGEDNYTVRTKEDIFAAVDGNKYTTALTSAERGVLKELLQFVTDYNTLNKDLVTLKTLSEGGSVSWSNSGLDTVVNHLVAVSSCTLNGTAVGNLADDIFGSMGLLTDGQTKSAVITNGIIKRFEDRTGARIEVLGLPISVQFMGTQTIIANITTSATEDYFNDDLEKVKESHTASGNATLVAKDTYGLALDLWVRTNVQNSYLTLEGNILTEKDTVRATGVDKNGNSVELYTITTTAEVTQEQEDGTTTTETVTYTDDVYQLDGTWYYADNHAEISEDELGDTTPKEKWETIETVIGYEGENRVWGDNQLLSTDSTTQGSGSCYTYYADTPEDQARSLELLDAMYVVFVDGSGNQLATAYMDTAHHYASNGRVIVPLVLRTTDSIDLGADIDGNIQYGIMPLEKNVATRVTALVYLDGTKLTNEDVLSASDIQGQLNIQFGSSVDLTAARDETLESAERRVSASVNKTAFDYDTATEAMTTTVTVNVDGDEPSTVTAFFMRAISDTQGSRQETMTFTKQADGTWTADHTFTTPGKYVLRTVRLDGVDYTLETCPEVVVTGFTISSLTCDLPAVVMTAEESYPVAATIKFATDDPEKLPQTVQGRFLRDDGTAVNVNFTRDTSTQDWNGSATFYSSGTYTLQYLVLDGEYVELDAGLQKTATLYLGMRVAVYTTSPQRFKFVWDEMDDNMKNLGMQVVVMDDTGTRLTGLDNVKLYYSMRGSVTKGFYAELTWNASSGYYEGTFTVDKSGVFLFSRVTVGSNNITKATTSPTFNIESPEPPTYGSNRTDTYQFAPNNDATIKITMNNADAAEIVGIVQNVDTSDTYEVNGELTDDGCWTFAVPKDNDGNQDGNWQLIGLKLGDVYDADSNAYTLPDNPMEMDLSDKNIVTKVVATVKITYSGVASTDYGKTDGTVTGAFMDNSYSFENMVFTVEDFEHKAIEGISAVSLSYEYGNDSQTYGGYTGVDNADANFSVEFTTTDNIHFTQSEKITLQYAGSYTPKLTVTIGDETKTYTNKDVPTFTVSSITPSVKISGVSPTTAIGIDTGSGGSGYKASGGTNTYTATQATVYIQCTRTGSGSRWSPYYYCYTSSRASVNLSNSGYAGAATLTFKNSSGTATDKLYQTYSNPTGKQNTTEGSVSGYSWGGSNTTLNGCNGTKTLYVGYSQYSTSFWGSANGAKTPAGTITADTLVLTYNGQTYNVPLGDKKITINNPY